MEPVSEKMRCLVKNIWQPSPISLLSLRFWGTTSTHVTDTKQNTQPNIKTDFSTALLTK